MNRPRRTLAPIAGEIYAALGRHRRSLGDLALALGISESTLRRRLENPGKITLDELGAITRELNVRPADVMTALEPSLIGAAA